MNNTCKYTDTNEKDTCDFYFYSLNVKNLNFRDLF